MTKDQLGHKLEAVIELLNFQWNVQPMIPTVIWSKMKKDEAIKELIKHRCMYFEKDIDVRTRIEAEVRKDCFEKYPTLSRERVG